MDEPEKPFACTQPDCGMTFTNEDHLHVHTKKHDMVLQFGCEQKAAFVADQTPTPTRFIRNCEEVGLFQDLQNVNPFDEGFKRAMETKTGILCLEGAMGPSSSDDALHTPQMVFPLLEADSTLFTNNQRNITISRSSSDESGTIKEYETTTISKLTNEVTTISRIVGKPDADEPRKEENRDIVNETSVSYTNNVIKILSNVEIRKDSSFNVDNSKNAVTKVSYIDSVIKDSVKDVLLTDNCKTQDKLPIMSQKSIDLVMDSLTNECQSETKQKDVQKSTNIRKTENQNTKEDTLDYEVIIKLPSGKQVQMKPVGETADNGKAQNETKEKLKKVLTEKAEKSTLDVQQLAQVPAGTLYPLALVGPVNNILAVKSIKIPIAPFNPAQFQKYGKTDGAKNDANGTRGDAEASTSAVRKKRMVGVSNDRAFSLESKSAASKRYRQRLKESMNKQNEENKQLKALNESLKNENAALKLLITQHLKDCPNADSLRRFKRN